MASYYSELASQTFDRPHGSGLAKTFSNFVNKLAVRDIRRALKPVAQHLFNTAEEMAFQGIDMAPQMMAMSSGMSGMGVRKRGRPKSKRGGALMPSGY